MHQQIDYLETEVKRLQQENESLKAGTGYVLFSKMKSLHLMFLLKKIIFVFEFQLRYSRGFAATEPDESYSGDNFEHVSSKVKLF